MAMIADDFDAIAVRIRLIAEEERLSAFAAALLGRIRATELPPSLCWVTARAAAWRETEADMQRADEPVAEDQ